MNACYVMLRYPVLSETFIRDEISALEELGHRVMTVSLEGPAGADIALGSRRTRSWWTLSRVGRFLCRRPAAVIRAVTGSELTLGMRLKLVAAAWQAREAGTDTVHAHFAYRNADAAAVIGSVLGTGHSVTVHAHDIFVENAHLARRLHAARKVVTVCRYNADYLTDRYPEVRDRLSVIPCSTRLDVIPETATGRQAGSDEPPSPVILSVGRLVEKKGFDDLIQASALLEDEFRLVIIGDGPLEARLRGLVDQLGLADKVTMLGAMDHAGALRRYRDADIFCLACKIAADGDRDSMPVVTKEAMAAGLPVVSTREVGVPEMVDDGRTGILVPPSDPRALASALSRLLQDPAGAAAMGREGRKVVEERFDLRQQARQVAATIGPVPT